MGNHARPTVACNSPAPTREIRTSATLLDEALQTKRIYRAVGINVLIAEKGVNFQTLYVLCNINLPEVSYFQNGKAARSPAKSYRRCAHDWSTCRSIDSVQSAFRYENVMPCSAFGASSTEALQIPLQIQMVNLSLNTEHPKRRSFIRLLRYQRFS